LNHIKHALPEGYSGIVRFLEQHVYLTRIKGKYVHEIVYSLAAWQEKKCTVNLNCYG